MMFSLQFLMLLLTFDQLVLLTNGSTQPPSSKGHSDVEHEEAIVFMERIFAKYGSDGVMTYEGFEHLLVSLGIGNLKIVDHDIHDHYVLGNYNDLHTNHNHSKLENETKISITESEKLFDDVTKENKNVPKQSSPEEGKKMPKRFRKSVFSDKAEESSTCMSPAQILRLFHLTYTRPITEDNFLHICPAIIYQIDKRSCSSKPCDDIHDSLKEHLQNYHPHDLHRHNDSVTSLKINFWEISGKTWGFSLLSVSVISLVGLVCVAIIPVMQRLFFNHIIQFLVALAIGSLTGDALLHLLPHALVPHNSSSHDEHDNHNSAVYKGLAVLLGVYVFFLAERGVTYISQVQNNRASRKKKALRTHESESFQYSTVAQEPIGQRLPHHNQQSVHDYDVIIPKITGDCDVNNAAEELQQLRPMKGQLAIQAAADTSDELNITKKVESIEGHSSGSLHLESKGHGHSHKVPDSVSSVAWMVIMGDGLHNFCDGLAIGASFASSITGGLSTSVAVFCHELPHELGDFAVLLKAGMSAKQALFYNLVSSVLCFMGLVIGLLVGNLKNVDSWIFCLVGGMFIYISLVDMLPELTRTTGSENQCCFFLLQCLGITTGVGIMMLIALYEKQISLGIGDTST